MKVQHSFDRHNGFAAWVPGTNLAAYAYPTSDHATAAKRNPDCVARRMIVDAIDFAPSYVEICGYSRMVDRAEIIREKVA